MGCKSSKAREGGDTTTRSPQRTQPQVSPLDLSPPRESHECSSDDMEDKPIDAEDPDGNSRFIGFLDTSSDGSVTFKYRKCCLLGHGSYAEAWLVRRCTDKMKFVAKMIDVQRMSSEERSYVDAEIECLRSLKGHPAIIGFEECFLEDNYMVLVMEYAKGGDLEKNLKSRCPPLGSAQRDVPYEEREVCFVFVMTALALEYIHQHRMLHRDVKAANIFIMGNGLVKLGDFGLSSQYQDSVSKKVAKTVCGTPYYFAPELWQHQRYDKKADVWALGVLVYELMALRRPFAGRRFQELKQAVLQQDPPPLGPLYSKELRTLCMRMLEKNPTKRPSIQELFCSAEMKKVVEGFHKHLQRLPEPLLPTDQRAALLTFLECAR